MQPFIGLLSFLLWSISLSAQHQKIATKDALADLDYLLQTIEKVHYNSYFKTPKSTLFERKDSLTQWETDSISMFEFTSVAMQLTTLLSGGHTKIEWLCKAFLQEIWSKKLIPFKASFTTKKQWLVTHSLDKNIAVGSIITHINQIPVAQLQQQMLDHIGGIPTFKANIAHKSLPFYSVFTTLKAPYTIHYQQKTSYQTEGIDLNTAAEFVSASFNRPSFTFEIIDNNIGYLAYNSCDQPEEFKAFLVETFKELSDKNISRLIIDLRYNGGGNSAVNDLLIPYFTRKKHRQSSYRYWKVSQAVKHKIKQENLWSDHIDAEFRAEYLNTPDQALIQSSTNKRFRPKKPPYFFKGKHCVLIGPATFSSANFLADAIKTYQLSTLIGRPTGEWTNDFGEQVEFQMPHSGIYFFTPTTFDIGNHGNESIQCPVVPDIETDQALDAAKKWLD